MFSNHQKTPRVTNNLPYSNLRVFFKTKFKLIIFFTFKEKIPIFLHAGCIYEFKHSGCNATYYRKTKRHFKLRMCEHLGVFVLTGKIVKGDDDYAINEHHLFCNHSSSEFFHYPAKSVTVTHSFPMQPFSKDASRTNGLKFT